MLKILKTLLVPIQDNNGELSGKRLLGTICILTALYLSVEVALASLKKVDVPIAENTMLIAPLFATGIAFWGLTAYYQNKRDDTTNDHTHS